MLNPDIGPPLANELTEYVALVCRPDFWPTREWLERFPFDLNREGYRGSLGRANQILFLR